MLKYQPLVKQETTNEGAPHVSATDVSRAFGQKYNNIIVKLKYNCYICNSKNIITIIKISLLYILYITVIKSLYTIQCTQHCVCCIHSIVHACNIMNVQ